MDKNLKNTENEAQIIKKEDLDQHNSRGIYMRDDHCDWGSSGICLLYTSPSPRDRTRSRMPSSA